MKDKWDSKKYKSISGLQGNISNELISQLPFKGNYHVLDAGCGTGDLTFKVAGIVKEGFVLGIDSSPSMIEKCNESLQSKNLSNVRFITKDINELDFSGEFDIVYSNSVFHWVKDPVQALDLLYESLKLSGSMGIQFPLLNSLHPMIIVFNKAVKKLKLEDEYRSWKFPWYVPASDDFKALMEKKEFEEVKVYKKSLDFNYGKSINLYKSFDSAGLGVFASVLSKEKAEAFRAEIKKEIETLKNSDNSTVSFERLFALGFRKLTNR